MTASLALHRDGWLNFALEDDGEGATVTRLKISAGDAVITRSISKRAGGESEAVNVSLLPLAEFLADAWWPLLYEPLRPSFTRAFRIRHRLDSGMRGYAFPALALCSGGENAVALDWANLELVHSPLSFLTVPPVEPIQLDRQQAEFVLMDLVEVVLERLPESGARRQKLWEAWERVRESMADPEELGYCIAAGRLGLDPYDPEGPDLERMTRGLSDELFRDLSEVVELDQLAVASDWLRNLEPRLALFPEIELGAFGSPVADDLNCPAWAAGEASAIELRAHTGYRGETPRRTVDELFGPAIFGARSTEEGPQALTGVARRLDHSARIALIAKSARQRRFRACSAGYIAWTSGPGEDRAATEAITRRQQASRAFAAEMLAPRDVLLEMAPRYGFDSDDLETIASDFICPYPTVMWQAHRAGIPLRGVELPFVDRPRIL